MVNLLDIKVIMSGRCREYKQTVLLTIKIKYVVPLLVHLIFLIRSPSLLQEKHSIC